MLQIRIHCAQDRCIRVPPPVQNGPGQTCLPTPHQQAHARIVPGNRRYDFGCSVAAVIVDDEDLVVCTCRIESHAGAIQKCRNVSRLVQCGDDKSELLPRVKMRGRKRPGIHRFADEGYARCNRCG